MFGPALTGGDIPGLVERYLETAARKEGVVNFGTWDFREPFNVLLHDLVHEARLSPRGRLVTPYYLMQLLRMRLRVQHAASQQQPATIQRPIFVLGLPRTGSTLLHTLLSHHPDLRAPTFWESHHWPRGDWRDFVTQRQCDAQLLAVSMLAPDFRRIHELGTLAPHECVSIQALSFRSMQFHAAYRLPNYNRAMSRAGYDWLPAYRWHAQHLGLLQQDQRRWVFKAPAHMLGIGSLMQVYPDALFVQTHRDPATVIPSMASLTASLRRITSNEHNPDEIGADVNNLWLHGITQVMQQRVLNPTLNARFFDVRYDRLMANPANLLQQICRFSGLTWQQAYAETIANTLKQNPAHKHGKHAYSLAQFGLQPEQLAEQYADYNHQYLNV